MKTLSIDKASGRQQEVQDNPSCIDALSSSLPRRDQNNPLDNRELLCAYLNSRDMPFAEIAKMPVQLTEDGNIYRISTPAGSMWEHTVLFAKDITPGSPTRNDNVVIKATGGTPESLSNETIALKLITDTVGHSRNITKFPGLIEASELPSTDGTPRMVAVMNFRAGSDLDKYCEQNSIWRGQAHSLEVAISATRGVKLLHQLGIIHKDLFGRNIQVSNRRMNRRGASHTAIIDFDLCDFLSTSPAQQIKFEQQTVKNPDFTDSDPELLSTDVNRFAVGVLGALEFKQGLSRDIRSFIGALRGAIEREGEGATLKGVESSLIHGLRCVRQREFRQLRQRTDQMNSPYFDLREQGA